MVGSSVAPSAVGTSALFVVVSAVVAFGVGGHFVILEQVVNGVVGGGWRFRAALRERH